MDLITFDNFPDQAKTKVLVITGTVDARVNSLSVGSGFDSLDPINLSGQRFSAVLELVPGRNEFLFQPYSITNTPLTPTRKVIYLGVDAVEVLHTNNSLDFHGAELGFDRLRGEKNASYKTRLLQAAKCKALTREYVPTAVPTEIGMPVSINMLRIYADRTSFERPKATNIYIRITLTDLELACDQDKTVESPIVFDNQYPYVTPSSIVSPFGTIKLLTENRQELAIDAYEYDGDTNRIKLKDESYIGKDLILEYNSVTQFSLDSDIASLKTAVDSSNRILLEVFEADFHDDSTLSSWIIPKAWTKLNIKQDFPTGGFADNPGIYLNVSEIKTYVLSEFRDSLLEDGSGIGTKLEKYLGEIIPADHRSWDQIVLGRDGLRDATELPFSSDFPNLMDQVRGSWGLPKYNIHQVAYINDQVYEFSGIKKEQWQSGSGMLGDLEPGVVEKEPLSYGDIIERSKNPFGTFFGVL